MDNLIQILNKVPTWVLILLVTGLFFVTVMLFKNFLKYLEGTGKNIMAKLELQDINSRAADYALDKLLPRNGKGYYDYKKEKKAELMGDKEFIQDQLGNHE